MSGRVGEITIPGEDFIAENYMFLTISSIPFLIQKGFNSSMTTTTEAHLAEAAAEFQEKGYYIARGLFSPAEVEEIRELFTRMHATGVPGQYEPKPDSADPLDRYPRVMQPHRFDETSRRYMLHPGVQAHLTEFFRDEPAAAQSMYYFKPPGGRGQAMHQDQFYLLVQPNTCIAAWTAIDDCDVENGAMYVVPNTQNHETVCPDLADETVSFSQQYVPVPKGNKPVLAQMKAGDTLFFNGNVIHGSGPNRSKDRFRRSFICHYVAASTTNISKFYLPLVRLDGTDVEIPSTTLGGPCGTEFSSGRRWEGAVH
jgi:hypothetical protein